MAAITTSLLKIGESENKLTGRSFGPTGSQKRGLRGAFFGLPYIGPVLTVARVGTQTIVHAVMGDPDTSEAGGAAGTTGYREKDTYSSTGGEIEDCGLSAADGADVISNTRPTGRLAFNAKGIPGGSTVSDKDRGGTEAGEVIDVAGRATSTGTDRFGRTKGVANAGAGLGTYDYTNFDGRPTLSGDGGRSLGDAGRGSMTTDGETVAQVQGRPAVSTTAAASGTIAVIDGGSQEIDIDIDDADQTGGANGRVGAVVTVIRQDADDADEDRATVAIVEAIGTGSDTIKTGAVTGLTSGATYTVYAQFIYEVADGGGTAYALSARSAPTDLAIA